ncbi:hypothetical protein [Marinobacterium rhizophilum]|uniref:hypothetical protein n=1 Tax=Marinobacterium rhizophilum TaxID=420402 RepID=UPI0012EB4281|nr:hypothetical protein [Marinobacterium rhizophilum]
MDLKALIQDKEKEENDSQLHYCAIQHSPVIGLFPFQTLTLRFDTHSDLDLYAHAGATGRSMIRKAKASQKKCLGDIAPGARLA